MEKKCNLYDFFQSLSQKQKYVLPSGINKLIMHMENATRKIAGIWKHE